MKLAPLSEAVGMVVSGLQLGSLSDVQADLVNDAWAEHGLLVFRDQELTSDGHVRLAEQLGQIDVNRFFASVDGYDMIADVRKEATDELNIGGGWHTDHSYDPEPARGSILVARELPPVGGATRFLSTELAWRTLPEELKERVAGLDAVHSSEHIFGEDSNYAKQMGERFGNRTLTNRSVHPVVIAHPVTGTPSLYVNAAFTTELIGLDAEDSGVLLMTLFKHIAKVEHAHEFDWAPGSVAMWDNRSTWHWALNDYQGHRRVMHRITLAGDALDRAPLGQPA
jgi:taurine dioxygenase